MELNKLFRIILVIVFSPIFLFAQDGSFSNYIVIDSISNHGLVYPRKDGKIDFKTNRKGQVTVYDATQVKEFTYNKKLFDSYSFQGKKEFYERVVTGEDTLYRKGHTYLIRSNNAPLEMDRKNFRSVLKEKLNCSGDAAQFSRVIYTPSSIKNIVMLSNAGQCDLNSLRYRKFGVYAGYTFFQFNGSMVDGASLSGGSQGAMAGIFGDFPVFRRKNLYFTFDAGFISSVDALISSSSSNTYRTADIKLSGITVTPIGAKWVFNRKLSPYIRAGLTFSYLNVTSNAGYLTSTVTPSYEVNSALILIKNSAGGLYGLNTGGGIQVPISKRKNLHVELRYTYATGADFDPLNLGYSAGSIIAGFNI